ncbi:MAG: hypothetical protein KDD38_09675, partial [Bdellovibrionales bacterium]|nr:hypothetical protein [Bdellovibrionales bacterium]
MNSSLDKDRWYIDISGRIELMTAWQIIEGLLSLNLKIIYRVSRDKVKWAAICNQPYFEDAVQDLIKTLSDQATKYGAESAQKAGLGESTGFTNIKNITSQINDQLEHANQLQEINVHLQRLRNLAGDIAAKKKLIISAQTKADEEELHPDDKNEYLNNPSLWERIQARFNFANSKTRQ